MRYTVEMDATHCLPPYVDKCKLIDIEAFFRRSRTLNAMFPFDVLRGALTCSGYIEIPESETRAKRTR